MGEPLKVLHPDPDHGYARTTAFSFDLESRSITTAHRNWEDDPNPDACINRTWDLPAAVLTGTGGHSNTVSKALSYPDNVPLLSSEYDTSTRVRECGTWAGKQTGPPMGEAGFSAWYWKRCLRLGVKYMPTRPAEGLVQLSRTGDGECVATLTDEDDEDMTSFEYSPNNQFLVSGDANGMVCIRRLPRLIGE